MIKTYKNPINIPWKLEISQSMAIYGSRCSPCSQGVLRAIGKDQGTAEDQRWGSSVFQRSNSAAAQLWPRHIFFAGFGIVIEYQCPEWRVASNKSKTSEPTMGIRDWMMAKDWGLRMQRLEILHYYLVSRSPSKLKPTIGVKCPKYPYKSERENRESNFL